MQTLSLNCQSVFCVQPVIKQSSPPSFTSWQTSMDCIKKNVIRFYPRNVFYIEYSFLSQATASQWSLTWQCLCDKHMYTTGKATPPTKHSGQPYSSFLSLSLATSSIYCFLLLLLSWPMVLFQILHIQQWREENYTVDANCGHCETQIGINREFNIAFAWGWWIQKNKKNWDL